MNSNFKRAISILLVSAMVLVAPTSQFAASKSKSGTKKSTKTVAVKRTKTLTANTVKDLKAVLAKKDTKVVNFAKKGSELVIKDDIRIPKGVTVSISTGATLIIEGEIVNMGTISLQGSVGPDRDMANAVMRIKAGSKLTNKGIINLGKASFESPNNGPIGGRLVVLGGEVINDGKINLVKGNTNVQGGLMAIADGTVVNNSIININGMFLQIDEKGKLINSVSGTINNNATFSASMPETAFENKGKLNGYDIVKFEPMEDEE